MALKTSTFDETMEFYSPEERPIADTWRGMEACVAAGKTKGIGVSNFSVRKLKALLLDSTIPPAVNQVERHPFLQQAALLHFCHAHNIHVTCYSPLGSVDRPAQFKAADEPRILECAAIQQMAQRLCTSSSSTCATPIVITPAQVVLKWAMQQGTSTIPKSVDAGRIAENLAAAAMPDLSVDDMNIIASLDSDRRFVDGTFWTLPPGSPYTLANLWDDES